MGDSILKNTKTEAYYEDYQETFITTKRNN